MVKLIFIHLPDGKKYEIHAKSGQSVMEAAIANRIPRIIGECGGACACGTCHVYIEKAAQKNLPAAAAMEEDILAFIDKAKPTSRLACQIDLTENMQELTLYLP